MKIFSKPQTCQTKGIAVVAEEKGRQKIICKEPGYCFLKQIRPIGENTCMGQIRKKEAKP